MYYFLPSLSKLMDILQLNISHKNVFKELSKDCTLLYGALLGTPLLWTCARLYYVNITICKIRYHH